MQGPAWVENTCTVICQINTLLFCLAKKNHFILFAAKIDHLKRVEAADK
jgi:hypothetical protein